MKNKTFSRKLLLNKETIAKLDQKEIRGGATANCTYPCPDTTDITMLPSCERTC